MQYKTVAGTAHFTVADKKELDDRVAAIADTINRELTGGWEFVGMYPVSATIDHKMSSSFMQRHLGGGYEDGNYTVNMMVFRKP